MTVRTFIELLEARHRDDVLVASHDNRRGDYAITGVDDTTNVGVVTLRFTTDPTDTRRLTAGSARARLAAYCGDDALILSTGHGGDRREYKITGVSRRDGVAKIYFADFDTDNYWEQ